ncbi:MAG: hypothetical protein ACP5O4_01160 [bacterium]
MSIVSIGALFLLGGILASSAGLITAFAGASTTFYNIATNKNEKNIVDELFSKYNTNINEYIQNVRNIIKNQLLQLRDIVSNMNVVKELENQKNRLLNEIDNLYNSKILYNLDQLDQAQSLQNSVKNIVNIFNDLKSNNEIYLQQYNDILNKIQKKINNFKNNKDFKDIIKTDLNSYNLEQLKDILDKIEKLEIEINVKQKELSLKQQLSKIEIINKEISNHKQQLQKEQLVQRIEEFIQNIKQIDKDYNIQTKIDNLNQIKDINNLELIKNQVALEYYNLLNNVIYTKGYKEKIKGFIDILNSLENTYKTNPDFSKYYPYYEAIFNRLRIKLNDVLNSKYILKDDALKIEQEFLDTISLVEKNIELEYIKDTIKSQFNEILKDIGYEVIDQDLIEKFYQGQVIYIDTIYGQNYKVQAKLEDSKLFLRLVRVFKDQKEIENLTDYEKQKDLEISKNWCKDLDKIIEKLKDKGILMDTIKRVEPEESQLTYIVNEELIKDYKVIKSFKQQKDDKYLAQDL